ncbi:MAG: cytochrome c-type biogenesis protein CcmH [Rhodospirillales bacterium]|nr:cytochrome c-type biogenesis protein CcmH [Rhodospirillales bacterium]
MKTALSACALLILAFGICFSPPARAVQPNEVLANPVLEARAREISKGLRCIVCQNQSIDDSNAELARDLRVLVRERLVAGDSDADVIGYVVSRYGDYVLLDPPVQATTLILWFGPLVFVFLGLIGIILYFRRHSSGGNEAAS